MGLWELIFLEIGYFCLLIFMFLSVSVLVDFVYWFLYRFWLLVGFEVWCLYVGIAELGVRGLYFSVFIF